MTFLELVRRTRQECTSSGTAPETVLDQTGMNARFVNWVRDAWVDIQSSQEYWKWMREEFSFALTPGFTDYLPFALAGQHANLPNFARWHEHTFRLYLTAAGVDDEQILVDFDWDDFRDTYRFGTRPAPNRPGAFGIRPRDEAIIFDAAPVEAYTCVGEYQVEPVMLALDDDTPAVEARFHLLIVYDAMERYGIDQAASEVIARAQAGRLKLMPEFERRYLPRMRG